MRVWMRESDAPGLAMSRSLGDGLAHSLGVSTSPEVKRFCLDSTDKFIILASDGVWEFLSNEDIAKIVWPHYIKNSPEQAGNAIVRAAAKKWRKHGAKIDDITCVTIFPEVDNCFPQISPKEVQKVTLFKAGFEILNPSQQKPYCTPSFTEL